MVTRKLKYFEFGSHTDKGKVKPAIYDGYAAFDSPNGYVFVLCDAADEFSTEAKDIALERIRYFMEKEYVESPYEAVQSALIYTGGYIYKYARKYEGEYKDMAIGCLCVLIRDNKVYYSSIGNCHMFLFDGRRLHLLTQQESGELPETKLLGTERVPSPFVCQQALVPLNGDMILMCTDGLYNYVSEKNIKKTLSDPMPVYTKACRLADIAKQAGSDDNVTLQLVSFYNLDHYTREFVEAELPPESEDEELPGIVKGEFTKDSILNKIIIGVLIIIAGYMFYDLLIFNPRQAKELSQHREVPVNDTIPETTPEDTPEATPEPTPEPTPVEVEETGKSVNVIDFLNFFGPDDTVYVVQSGDTWSTIYQRFEVCSWFIRNHEENVGKFDRREDPVTDTRITIPLKYSANSQYNPRFYQKFTTDEVGSACQYAGEEFLNNLHESIKERYSEQ